MKHGNNLGLDHWLNLPWRCRASDVDAALAVAVAGDPQQLVWGKWRRLMIGCVGEFCRY